MRLKQNNDIKVYNKVFLLDLFIHLFIFVVLFFLFLPEHNAI